jgi:putative flippase GtrA
LGTDGNFGSPNIIQLMVQVQGLAAAIAYSMVMAYIAGFLLTFRKKSTRKALVNSGT